MHGSTLKARFRQPIFVARESIPTVLVAALLFLNACSSIPTRLAYVATGTGVLAYRIDENTGSSVAIIDAPFLATTSGTTFTSPASLAVHPSNRFLYVTNQDQGTVSRFKIDSLSGALTEVLPRAQAGISPGPMMLNTSGDTLFVANQGSNNISVFSVASSGVLSETSVVSLASPPTSLALLASSNFLFVGLPNLSAVDIFSVSPGSLTRVPGSPFSLNTSIGLLAVDNLDSLLFVPNPSQNTVSAFSVQASGSLGVVPGSPFATGVAPVAALVSPGGGFLYVINSGATTISQYSISALNGTLTALTDTSPTVGTNPQFLVLDPSGKYVFVANVGSSSFTELSFNSDGSLANTSNSISVGAVPRALAFTR
jgi:6-phosphogluconolactonase